MKIKSNSNLRNNKYNIPEKFISNIDMSIEECCSGCLEFVCSKCCFGDNAMADGIDSYYVIERIIYKNNKKKNVI